MKTICNTISIFFIILVLLLVPCVSATPVIETVTSSGTWTCPQGVFIIQVKMCGGGGGALGGNQTWNGFAGLNSSLYSYADVPVIPGVVYPITIGAGGIGSVGSSGSLDYVAGTSGGNTVAFGNTVFGGNGATSGVSRQQRGLDGYGYVTLAKAGGDGTGNVTYAQAGGAGGIGYGASGGGGGASGYGGTGGYGGQGASGVVEITYDPDASNVLFAGTTYNAQTGAALTGVTGTIAQGSTSVSINTGGGSTFSVLSSNGIITGTSVTITMTKAGYYTYTYTFVPYISEIIPLNIGLIPTTFNIYANGTISGLTLNQYGSIIPSASIAMVNATGSILSTTSSSGGMYYFQNVQKNTIWASTASKSGYANTSTTFYVGDY